MTATFHREYVLRLPRPIAQLYWRAYNDKSSRSRHDCSYYAFEAVMKLAVAVVVAEYAQERREGGRPAAALDACIGALRRPSEGQWLGMLREGARYFGHRVDVDVHPLGHVWSQLTRKQREPEVLELYHRLKCGFKEREDARDASPPGSVTLLELFESLVSYRNDVIAHGGAPRFDAFYEAEMGPLLLPALNWMLRPGVFEYLGKEGTRLLFLHGLERGDDGHEAVAFSDVTGIATERLPKDRFRTHQAEGWHPGDLFASWPNQSGPPLRLSPLLAGTDDDANGIRVLFLSGNRKLEVEFISYDGGSGLRGPAAVTELAALLSLVEGRAVDPVEIPTAPEVDDYIIEAKLGEGGMGVVYLARHNALGLRHALKMIPAHRALEPIIQSRFHREIRALMSCNHPNVVKFLSYGRLKHGSYYAMEYVKGCTLEAVLSSLSHSSAPSGSVTVQAWDTAVSTANNKEEAEPPPPTAPAPATPVLPRVEQDYVRRVVAVMHDATRALAEVHRQKIVHRDVKPGNLMLEADSGRVVLLDFGLAKGTAIVTNISTHDHDAPGTLRYMAPEQLSADWTKGSVPAELGDIRAVGVTLWELLTRRRLFAEAQNTEQLRTLIKEVEVPLLRSVDPSFDADIEAIVYRAAARDPKDRIASATLLAEYLAMYLAGKDIPIRTPSRGERLGRWARANRVVLALSTLAAALLVVVGLVMQREADPIVQPPPVMVDDGEAARLRLVSIRERAERFRRTASTHLDEGDVPAATLYLGMAASLPVQDPAREELDALRFHFALEQCPRPLPQRLDAGGPITASAFSPDGKWLVVGRQDGTVLSWNTLTGSPRYTELLKHARAVRFVGFSPDGTILATTSGDATAKIWDAPTGRMKYDLPHKFPVMHVAFDTAGERFATASGMSDFRAGTMRPRVTERPILPNQGTFVSAEFASQDPAPPAPEQDPDFDWDRGFPRGGEVRVFEVATGKMACDVLPHDFKVMKCSFTPDGSRVISSTSTPRLAPSRLMPRPPPEPGPVPAPAPEADITPPPPAPAPPPPGRPIPPRLASILSFKATAGDTPTTSFFLHFVQSTSITWHLLFGSVPPIAPMPPPMAPIAPIEHLEPVKPVASGPASDGNTVFIWDWRKNRRVPREFEKADLLDARLGRGGGLWLTWLKDDECIHEFWDSTRDTLVLRKTEKWTGSPSTPMCWVGDPDALTFRYAHVQENKLRLVCRSTSNVIPFGAPNEPAFREETTIQEKLPFEPRLLCPSPLGDTLAMAAGTKLILYSITSRRYETKELAFDHAITHLHFAPSGRFLEIETDHRSVSLLDLSSDLLRREPNGEIHEIDPLMSEIAGDYVLLTTNTGKTYSRHWIDPSARSFELPLVSEADTIAGNQDGSLVVVLVDNRVSTVDIATGRKSDWAHQPEDCVQLSCDPKGQHVLTISEKRLLGEPPADAPAMPILQTLQLREALTGKPLGPPFTMERPLNIWLRGTGEIVVITEKGQVRFFDAVRGLPTGAIESKWPFVHSVKFFDNDFATAEGQVDGGDPVLILWDLKNRLLLEELSRKIVPASSKRPPVVSFSPTGRYLLATPPRKQGHADEELPPPTITVWNRETGTAIGRPIPVPGENVHVDISPDEKYLVAFYTPEAVESAVQMRIWSLPGLEPVTSWMKVNDRVVDMVFSSDSREVRFLCEKSGAVLRLALKPHERTREDMRTLGEVLSRRVLDEFGFSSAMTADQFQAARQSLSPGAAKELTRSYRPEWFMSRALAGILWDVSLTEWNEYLASNPGNPAAWRAKADVLAELGLWRPAADLWTKHIDREANVGQITRATLALLHAGRKEEARKMFTLGLTRPESPVELVPLYNAAMAFHDDLPLPDWAAGPLTEAAQKPGDVNAPDRVELQRCLGQLHYRKGRYAEAIEVLKDVEGRSISSFHPEVLFFLALAYHANQEMDKAQESLARASESYNRFYFSGGIGLMLTWPQWVQFEALRREAESKIPRLEPKTLPPKPVPVPAPPA